MALKKILKNSSGVPTGEYTNVAGGTLYADSPIATITPFGGLDDKIPSGWLKCNGQEVSRDTYAELFAVIGESFGAGDGTSTFNVPDLRETVPVGYGLNTGNSSITDHDSYSIGEFKDDQLQDHTHKEFVDQAAGDVISVKGVSANANEGILFTGNIKTGRKGTTTHGKQLGVNYIIKAKMVGVPADFMSAVDDAVGYVYQTSDVEGEYDANDFAVVGKTTRYCAKSPVHGYQVDGTTWWGFYETVCFRNGGYGYQTFRTMLGIPAMAIRQLYNGSWGNWQKLVTESDLNTVTSGNATRNTTYVSSTGFNATWNKTGRVCMASLKFNLAQNTTSIEEIITGFPAPIVDVNIVAQGDNNTAVSNLVLKTNGNIRTHYGGTANQFYQVTFTYITAS